jgi:hypothetical protein
LYASTGLTCLLCAYAGYYIAGLEVQAVNAKDNAQTMHRRFNAITTYSPAQVHCEIPFSIPAPAFAIK